MYQLPNRPERSVADALFDIYMVLKHKTSVQLNVFRECFSGVRCELCEDGFYGNPLGWGAEVRPCVRCECNGNVDPNAVGVCDHMTGRCLKCVGHTTGDHCEKCRAGYYGNALDNALRPEKKCKRKCMTWVV